MTTSRFVALLAALVSTALGTATAADERGRPERVTWRGHAQSVSVVVPPGAPTHPARCGTRPGLVVVGAGVTDLLGQMFVHQSHCLTEDGGFDGGQFEFTTDEGRTIRGRYHGTADPAFPPSGGTPPVHVLISGQTCVQRGTALHGIVNDCADDRYSPALGLLNLQTGEGTIFVDYKLGIRR